MRAPLLYRKSIPFFYEKSPVEFQKDRYERYDPMVIRQTALHLTNDLWKQYPLQPVLDFAQPYFPGAPRTITELGCSVGKWIATLAQQYPSAECWGLDFSYQLLKQAKDYWVDEKEIRFDSSHLGFAGIKNISGHSISNLHFGLAKAADLPFDDNSQDLVVHSFLIDRVANPAAALQEHFRVLSPGGVLVFVTPLNFQETALWTDYYPAIKIHQLLIQLGFSILDWQEDLVIKEPLDARGNAVVWRTIGVVAQK
jgi:ubiquinone/menaquinone biosynthesis C-methylase UbiE